MQGAKQGIIIVVIMIEKPNRPGKDTVEDSVNRFWGILCSSLCMYFKHQHCKVEEEERDQPLNPSNSK